MLSFHVGYLTNLFCWEMFFIKQMFRREQIKGYWFLFFLFHIAQLGIRAKFNLFSLRSAAVLKQVPFFYVKD